MERIYVNQCNKELAEVIMGNKINELVEGYNELKAQKRDEGECIIVSGNRWECKRKVEKLFNKKKELWYSDIARTLGLSLKLVVDLCEELELEGKIENVSKPHYSYK